MSPEEIAKEFELARKELSYASATIRGAELKDVADVSALLDAVRARIERLGPQIHKAALVVSALRVAFSNLMEEEDVG